jgi:hypothetical protein
MIGGSPSKAQTRRESAPALDLDEQLTVVRTRSRWTRRLVLPAAAAVLVLALAAVLLMPRTFGHDAAQPGAGPSAAFRITLVLSKTRAPADGTPLHGHVLVINQTGHPIEIQDGRCEEWLQAGLTGPHVQLHLISILVRCARTELREGTTRLPITIDTTYDRCLQGKQPGTPDSPHCRGPNDDQIPALPPGTYRARIRTQHTSTTPTLPKPIVVILRPVG